MVTAAKSTSIGCMRANFKIVDDARNLLIEPKSTLLLLEPFTAAVKPRGYPVTSCVAALIVAIILPAKPSTSLLYTVRS